MQNLLKTVKVQLSLTLLLIFITALIHSQSIQSIALLITTLTATIATDFLCLKLRGKPLFFPSSAIASAFIISLVTAPNLPLYGAAIAGIIAMFTKNFVRIQGRHMFNPAGLGLLVSAFIFGHSVSWWAVSFQQLRIQNLEFIIYFLILLSPAIISILRMKRFRIILSFILAYVALNFILNTKYLILNTLFDPTIIFFTLVMLPEPMTTPNNHIRQIAFGFFVALITIFVPSSISNLIPDSLIFSLLIGNLLFFKLR